jgi:hypothetical protein
LKTIAAALRGKPWTLAGLVLFALVLLAGGFAFGQATAPGAPATTAEPGSHLDPLISRSYFDQWVTLQVVFVPAGKALIGQGGAEFILRSGRATAIASASGGLANVTEARDIKQGENVPLNHLLIIPRTDGRGFRAVTDIYVMVRGPHEVK